MMGLVLFIPGLGKDDFWGAQAHVSRSAWVELAVSSCTRALCGVYIHTFNGVPTNNQLPTTNNKSFPARVPPFSCVAWWIQLSAVDHGCDGPDISFGTNV